MEKSSEIRYTQRPEATRGVELSALACVYASILQKHQERQVAARLGGLDDPERRSDEIRAETSIP